jgi:predicted TPR repeat methyltransferase
MAPMSTDQTLRPVIDAHKAGQLDVAEAGYRIFLNEHPDDPDALTLMGMLRNQQGRVDEAYELLRRAVEIAPDNARAQTNLGAVRLAQKDVAGALETYETVTRLAPAWPLAWVNLALAQRLLDRDDDAVNSLKTALRLAPRDAVVRRQLLDVLSQLRRVEEAAAVYQAWLKQEPDHPVPQHMFAATSGKNTPERASNEYIRKLFDDFAPSFDAVLRHLEYNVPQLACERLAAQFDLLARIDILDAGCGTGLCAPHLRSLARRLVGVDLSMQMVERAHKRKLYDELVVADFTIFMRSHRASFDAVILADTLCYFGSLDAPLEAARTCLKDHGVLVFSVEGLAPGWTDAEWTLEAQGRYCHSPSYVESTLNRAGFILVSMEDHTLRYDGNRVVEGQIVTART